MTTVATPTIQSGKAPWAPGPKGEWLLGSLNIMRADAGNMLLENARRYGHVVRFRMGPPIGHKILHLINEPKAIKYVLQEQARHFHKSIIYEHLKLVVGNGLLTSEDELWRRQRQLAQPAFHRHQLALFAKVMIDSTQQTLGRWESIPQPVDVASEMMRLALGIVSRALFTTDISGEADRVGAALTAALEYIRYRTYVLIDWNEKFGLSRWREFQSALEELRQVVYHLINERRANRAEGGREGDPDLLDLLMQAVDAETGHGMSDVQLKDEVITFLLAGHETTANAVTWAWYLLDQNRDAEAKLHEEIDRVLGGRAPTVEDLRLLPYTRRVIDETLRLYPPAWIIEREPLRDEVLGGYRIPRGSVLSISPFVLHRLEEFWPDPERFDPDRFLPEAVEARPLFTYLPFGGGPRLCIGMHFALMEATIILAMIASKYRLRTVPGHRVEAEPSVTLRPRYGLRMTLEPRTPAATP